ncbi:MAG: histidine kinase [Bacteroidales bacterium]|jgi:signal transduction histidine kinase|nr:histidine kinase [Bacteroidales bacterium]
MVLHIALILAFAFQLVASVISIRLVRETKYSATWILLSIGLLLMAALRFWDIISRVVYGGMFSEVYVWIGVISSFCFTVSAFFIRKVLFHIKDLEEARRQLEKRFLTSIIQAEEKERSRFAKEMHDGIGPLLSTVKLSISTLSRMESDENKKTLIKNSDNLINEAIKSIKEISNNLTPHVLTNFGLEKALDNFINKVNNNGVLQISFRSSVKNHRFDSNLEITLYRIVSELINNTIKHANATSVAIDLRLTYSEMRLIYTDDGIGFDPEKVRKSDSGMGLSNIFFRVDYLKGKIDIQSAAKEGVIVIISIPLKDEKFNNKHYFSR